MGEDNKVLELDNIPLCNIVEKPEVEVPQITSIERVQGKPLEATFEVSPKTVRDILYNIMRSRMRHSNNWYKLHGIKTTRKLYSERKRRKR